MINDKRLFGAYFLEAVEQPAFLSYNNEYLHNKRQGESMTSVINMQDHKKEKATAELTERLKSISALADSLEACDESLKAMAKARGGIFLTKAQYLELKLSGLHAITKDRENLTLLQKYSAVCAERVTDITKNSAAVKYAVISGLAAGAGIGVTLGLFLR